MSSKLGSLMSRFRDGAGKKSPKSSPKSSQAPAAEEGPAAGSGAGSADPDDDDKRNLSATWSSVKGKFGGAAARGAVFLKKFNKKDKPDAAPRDPSMLPQTKEEREREERILKILEEFKLQGGTYHTHLVMAKSGDRLLGGLDDEDVLRVVWYRMTEAGLQEIPGVSGGFYQPSLDDVGVTLLCRCQDSVREEFTGFGEIGPLVMDPAVESASDAILESGNVEFSVASYRTNDTSWKLTIREDVVALEGPTEEADEAEVDPVLPCLRPFSAKSLGLKIQLDPVHATKFKIVVPPDSLIRSDSSDGAAEPAGDDSGAAAAGSSHSHSASTAADLAAFAAAAEAALAPEQPHEFAFSVGSNTDRDILARVFRQFCFDSSALAAESVDLEVDNESLDDAELADDDVYHDSSGATGGDGPAVDPSATETGTGHAPNLGGAGGMVSVAAGNGPELVAANGTASPSGAATTSDGVGVNGSGANGSGANGSEAHGSGHGDGNASPVAHVDHVAGGGDDDGDGGGEGSRDGNDDGDGAGDDEGAASKSREPGMLPSGAAAKGVGPSDSSKPKGVGDPDGGTDVAAQPHSLADAITPPPRTSSTGDAADLNADGGAPAGEEESSPGPSLPSSSPPSPVTSSSAANASSSADTSGGPQTVASLQEALGAQRREVLRLQKALKSEKTKHQTVRRSLQASAAESSSLRTELSKVRGEAQKAAKMLSDAARALQAEEQSARTFKAEKEAALEKLASTETNLEATKEALASCNQSLESVQSRFDELQVRFQRTERDEKTKEKSLTEVQSETSALKAQVATLQESLAAAESAHRLAHESMLAMTTERDDFKEAVSTLRRRIRELEAAHTRALAELEEATTELTSCKASLSSAEEKAAADHATISGLRKSNAAATRRADAAEKSLSELKASTTDTSDQLARFEEVSAKLAKVEADLTAANETVDELTTAKNAAVRKAESLQRDLAKRVHGGISTERFEDLETRYATLTRRMQAVTAEKNDLQSKLMAARAGSPRGGGGRAGDPGGVRSSPGAGRGHSPGPMASPTHARVVPSASARMGMGMGLGVTGGSGLGTAAQNMELQRLANDLADQLHDKEVALAQQRATKELLAQRISELEREVARLSGK